ncbi:flagellar biosynthetic protein FliQ [Planctomycetales bacterium]|nr:flagellar biosynthetic protein FliQ [Planctomycetales bacterium]GHT00927.1 flagellar biosynthetic protein FliQ [Planctomycetales bacterium]GHT02260.1 flagellar biosynthetic protein FliQ [Planctomycetales bacterium]GHV18970.1 flagellar biosynthetic protein FliQ [Planctomycetales bacterium]
MPDVPMIIDVTRDMMYVAIELSMPVLLTALVVGVAISLFQTVTSVQEMTLTFVPKLIAVLSVVLLALPWMIDVINEYTRDLWSLMANYY